MIWSRFKKTKANANRSIANKAVDKVSTNAELPAAADGLIFTSLASLLRLRAEATHLKREVQQIRAPLQGLHLSTFKGRGMDFAESRPYQAGDDIRNLDWKVTARTGKAYTKLYQEERERPVLLCIDMQPSLFFATQGAYKSVVAAKAAALLAWNAWQHGDRVGGLLIDGNVIKEVRPARNKRRLLHLLHVLSVATKRAFDAKTLQIVTPQMGATKESASNPENSLTQALKKLRHVAHPGTKVYFISDFRQLNVENETHFMALSRHTDLCLLSLSDPLEQQLPAKGEYTLSDGKRFVQLRTGQATVQGKYYKRYQEREKKLQLLARKYAFSLIPLSTKAEVFKQLQYHLGRAL